MTYVSADVKDSVTIGTGKLSRMARPTFRRLAGVRFTFLIKQLQEDDPDKWSIQAIADAIGCDRSLVSKWHPDNVRQRREPADRSGLTDLTIQGIHDGLRVSSEYLFMPSSGLPNHVLLRDGTKRPCEPEEVDHKLFRLEDELVKRKLSKHDQEIVSLHSEMDEMRAMLRELLGKPAKSVR